MDIDPAALYARHHQVMRAVAGSVLRGHYLHDHVDDVVMQVMTSLMERPPTGPVNNWEAYLVRATRNKAVDVARSAPVRHAGGAIEDDVYPADHLYLADDVAERVDDQRAGAELWDKLSSLDPRDRRILWEHKALGRPAKDVAREFGISPSRVSQISTAGLRELRDALVKEGRQP